MALFFIVHQHFLSKIHSIFSLFNFTSTVFFLYLFSKIPFNYHHYHHFATQKNSPSLYYRFLFLFDDFNARSTTEYRTNFIDARQINKTKSFCCFEINFMKIVFFSSFRLFFRVFFAAFGLAVSSFSFVLACCMNPNSLVCVRLMCIALDHRLFKSLGNFSSRLHEPNEKHAKAFHCARSRLEFLPA